MSHTKKAQTLSIIIPAYNEERHMVACLEAVAAQTEMPDEVIVVDNNSTDKTRKLAAKFSFVKIVNEKRQGSVFASHAGMNQAKSDIIGRIDADSRLSPDWVAATKQVFANNPSADAYTGHCTFRDIPFPSIFGCLHRLFYYSLQRIIAGTEVLWGSNMAIRRSAWNEIADDCHLQSGIDEDIDISLCLLKKGMRTARSAQMQAQVAIKMHAKKSPRQVYGYLRSWPSDYFVNGYVLRGSIIWIIMTVCVITTIPASSVYWAANKLRSA